MKATPTTKKQPSDPGQGTRSVVESIRSKAYKNLEAYEKKVTRSPGKAILIALGTGYCLNRLPVGALLAVPLRLTAVLAKPALIVLGVAKLCEIAGEQSRR